MVDTTNYRKITEHPDKDKIVEKLYEGVSTRQIEAWLKQRYPHNSKRQVSYMTLQKFRKNRLNIEADALKDIQKERKELQLAKKAEQEQEKVKNTVAYQAGLKNYVQDSLIDYNAELIRMMDDIKVGVEQLKTLTDSGNPKAQHLNHQAITAYIAKMQDLIAMHKKMIDDQEKKMENQLESDYEELNQRMEILVESVREAFNQTNPEGLMVFLQLVKEKMNEAGLGESI